MDSLSYGKMPHILDKPPMNALLRDFPPYLSKVCASAQNVVHDQRLHGDQKRGEPGIQQTS